MKRKKMMKNTSLLSTINHVFFDENKEENLNAIIKAIMGSPLAFESKNSNIHRIAVSFDTETSTFRGKSYIYIWQLTVGETTYYGRYWFDFVDILKKIADTIDNNLYLGIANSGFDMSFYDITLMQLALNDDYNYSQINANPHHPVICEFYKKGHGKIKIVDVCKISGLSLENIGKNFCKHNKLCGCLDYEKVRTPKTKIEPWELAYCLFDTVVASEYLEYLYKTFTDRGKKFPLTATAMLRNDMKEMLKTTSFDFKSVPWKLFPKCYKDYEFYMNFLFRGGFTHANRSYVNRIITNVSCADYTSCYPAEMFWQKYPMEEFTRYIDLEGEFISRAGKFKDLKFEKDTAYIFEITIEGMRARTMHSVESSSKIIKTKAGNRLVKGLVEDNGRILQADKVKLCVTELDYLVLQKFYSCLKIKIENCFRAKKEYLPDYVLQPLLRAYVEKAKLKKAGLNHTAEYFVAKGMANAAYGNGVQKLNLIIDELLAEYDENIEEEKFKYKHVPEWQKMKNTEKYKDKTEEELKQLSYIKAKLSRFMSCYWGIYITAYARYKLLMQIWELEQVSPNCVVYCDTDSMYIKDIKKVRHIIDKWNRETIQKNKKFLPKEAWDLNTLDIDPPCIYFKTLGAKRYVKSYFENGELKTVATIAGLAKGTLEKEFNYDREKIYENFRPSLLIKKESTKKLVPSYSYEKYSDNVVDYLGEECECWQFGGCTLVNVDFKLKVLADFIKLAEKSALERMD